MDKSFKNNLLLVAGGTASGKSAILDEAVKVFDAKDFSLLRMDNYYKTLTQLGAKKVTDVNWDEPFAYNWDQIISDIKNLKNNKQVNGHKYNYQKGEYDKDEKFII